MKLSDGTPTERDPNQSADIDQQNCPVYKFPLRIIPSPFPSQDDCHSGGDAGNSFETATHVIPFVPSCVGEIKGGDDTEDWYQFSVSSGQAIVTLYQECHSRGEVVRSPVAP